MIRQIPDPQQTDMAEFKTKVGLVMATVGSAVGLGNIWRFPAETHANGGAAFLIVYVVCLLVLGIPVMLAEMSLGRAGREDAVGAFKRLAPGTPWWVTGALAILTAYLILCFYMVVTGWTFEYLWQSITGNLYAGTAGETQTAMELTFKERMEAYIATDWNPLINVYIVIAINAIVLMLGVQKGIEKMSNLLLPLLFVLLLVFCGYSLTMPGAKAGLEYFFAPDFSKLTWRTIGSALGQAFFSLSLGMGILITYASYYPKETKLVPTSLTVSLLDLLVAVLMGVIIFPAVASFNLDEESIRGTTLVFVTFPEVFRMMPGSQIWSVLFFLLLMVAALTSTISISEVSVSFLEKRFHRTRVQATLIVMLPLFIFSSLCSLSFGSLSDFTIFGYTIFDFLDNFTTNILLPVVSLLTVFFMGWFAPRGMFRNQVTNDGTISTRIYPTVLFVVKYLAPILIALILIMPLF